MECMICNHKEVCSYKGIAKNIDEKTKGLIEEEYEKIFRAEIKCKYFLNTVKEKENETLTIRTIPELAMTPATVVGEVWEENPYFR